MSHGVLHFNFSLPGSSLPPSPHQVSKGSVSFFYIRKLLCIQHSDLHHFGISLPPYRLYLWDSPAYSLSFQSVQSHSLQYILGPAFFLCQLYFYVSLSIRLNRYSYLRRQHPPKGHLYNPYAKQCQIIFTISLETMYQGVVTEHSYLMKSSGVLPSLKETYPSNLILE